MALNKSRMRSELPNTAHLKRLLAKIKAQFAEKSSRIVFQKAGVRMNAADLANVAIDETLGSGNITFQRLPFDDVAGTLELQDLTYTGAAGNADDNDVSIEYIGDVLAGSESVSVLGNAITIHIEDGVSTATQIKAAYDLVGAATALATVAISGTGSNAQDVEPETNLAGGVTAAAVESYDLADIEIIKRLRTKKWLIAIKDGANPA